MISIAIPYYSKMKDADFFMKRCLKSIENQSYKDYEIVITEEGSASHNTNEAIKKSKGDLIKILCMDDYLAHGNSLKEIVDNFRGEWLISGCSNNPNPYYTGDIHQGNNKLGGLSAITIKNNNPLLFDESLFWLLDCEYYRRMYDKYGFPVILNGVNVIIGEGEHQATNMLQTELKRQEVIKVTQMYAR